MHIEFENTSFSWNDVYRYFTFFGKSDITEFNHHFTKSLDYVIENSLWDNSPTHEGVLICNIPNFSEQITIDDAIWNEYISKHKGSSDIYSKSDVENKLAIHALTKLKDRTVFYSAEFLQAKLENNCLTLVLDVSKAGYPTKDLAKRDWEEIQDRELFEFDEVEAIEYLTSILELPTDVTAKEYAEYLHELEMPHFIEDHGNHPFGINILLQANSFVNWLRVHGIVNPKLFRLDRIVRSNIIKIPNCLTEEFDKIRQLKDGYPEIVDIILGTF